MKLRLGTRASPLARWQAEWVQTRLQQSPDVSVELVLISTQGDQRREGPIAAIGQQGVFTKELQAALLDGRIDLAVHSLKDLPTDPVPGLCLAAVAERAPAGDALLSASGLGLHDLPPGAIVGTGSQRRRAQLWHLRPDLTMAELRGNVDTRLKKLAAGDCTAIVLAEAGLQRLGLDHHIVERLPANVMIPAVGQGALGVETRQADAATIAAVRTLEHFPTRMAVAAERALLATLRGGCLAPIGALGQMAADGALILSAVVLSSDGKKRLQAERAARLEQVAALTTESPVKREPSAEAEMLAQAESLGIAVAHELLAAGASDLIAASRPE